MPRVSKFFDNRRSAMLKSLKESPAAICVCVCAVAAVAIAGLFIWAHVNYLLLTTGYLPSNNDETMYGDSFVWIFIQMSVVVLLLIVLYIISELSSSIITMIEIYMENYDTRVRRGEAPRGRIYRYRALARCIWDSELGTCLKIVGGFIAAVFILVGCYQANYYMVTTGYFAPIKDGATEHKSAFGYTTFQLIFILVATMVLYIIYEIISSTVAKFRRDMENYDLEAQRYEYKRLL